MFNFKNLDSLTRSYIVEAIDEAEQTNNIYYSARFNNAGREQWLNLLKEAAKEHNDHWLAFQLQARQLMVDFEGVHAPLGNYTIKHVPHNAAETMAEGQFNRFYILGLCKRAKSEGITELAIYRAKERYEPRSSSQVLIGKLISVDEIEAQLKETSASFKSSLVKPNSGLSAKLP